MKLENNITVVSQLSSENQKQTRQFRSVEESLKPVLVSLKIFGLYFDPNPAKKNVQESETDTSVTKPSWIFRAYGFAVLLLLWLNVIRCLVGLFPADKGMPYRIVLTTWYLQCSVNSTIMLASCYRLRHFRSFYKHWDSLYGNAVTKDIGCGFRCPWTFMKIALIAAWAMFAMNNAVLNWVLFSDLPQMRDLIVNIIHPFPEEQWAFAFITLMQVFENAAWIFPVAYFTVVSRVIQTQFLQFKCCLSKQIEEADGCVPDRLTELRCRYTQLCHAVDIFNGTYKWILGTSFFLEIFMACFISYLLINNTSGIINTVNYMFWLSATFLVIFVLTIGSSHVNDAAHSLLDVIFHVGTKNASPEQLGQVNLFVAKLTGTSIGFTAADFFVITREFLLSLCGLYATYFFILMQFRIA